MFFTEKEDSKSVKLYCFSPPIMIATFVIEIALAIYVFLKSRKAGSNLGIVFTLAFLGIFQLSEYMICRGQNPLLWSQIGIFVITFLPVFGLYLISRTRKETLFAKLSLVVPVAFAVLFIYFPTNLTGAACGGNYIILNVSPALYNLYGIYYFGFLLLGIWEAVAGLRDPNEKERAKKVFLWFIIGYLSFILPLTLVYLFLPGARNGMASIMCGFAVIFAVILTFKIAPIYHLHVKSKKASKIGK